MRLIEVNTLEMSDFSEFSGQETIPEYAILSHRWGEQEVEYKDFQELQGARKMKGFQKIQGLCDQAKRDRISHVCFEYAEAINSMYSWYAKAKICYVYLVDVPPLQDGGPQLSRHCFDWAPFENSVWFTRGWTLQELIAPRNVRFFNNRWGFFGALAGMIEKVSHITNIPEGILTHTRRPCDFSIAQQLSWAAERTTTRPEDAAYSLFGILDVTMEPVQNEGPRAFLRLQEYLIKHSTDQTIFAWDLRQPRIGEECVSCDLLLAPDPSYFFNGGRIRRHIDTLGEAAYELNNKGIAITLPIVQTLRGDESRPSYTLGILDCQDEDSSQTLALIMSPHPSHWQNGDTSLEYYVSGSSAIQGGRKIYSRLSQVSKRAHTAEAKRVTITKDLQSQKYMRASGANDASCFAVRFFRNELSQRLTLQDYFPTICWDAISNTLRLDPRDHPLGGVVIGLPDGRSALIGFRASSGSSLDLPFCRRLCDLAFLDSDCQLEPHLANLPLQRSGPGALHAKSLRLNEGERLYARLEHGLHISIERSVDDTHAGPEVGLSNMSQRDQHFSPPSRRRSSGQVMVRSHRRISDAGDGQISHGQQYQFNRPSYDYSPECANCQAKVNAERRQRRRLAEEEYFMRQEETRRQTEQQATRRQKASRRRSVQTAMDVVAGGTLASIMARPSGDSSDEE
ncbi:hypothetical protein LTR17_019245 [Elasticomyces elasticus]|nr:hypothetical protein LTR17_019245 [Elasticomyces elasticus]